MELIFLFLILLIVTIGIPFCISYLIYRWVKKRGFDRKLRLVSLIPILFVSYLIHEAIYPSKSFYKVDFKEATGIEFPHKGEIKHRTASFPDHFGDYTSSFLAELELNDLKDLEYHLKNNGFVEKKNERSSKELDYIEEKKGNKEYTKYFVREVENNKYYSVGFLNDNKSIIITKVSW
jgi:hypothetical protein